MKRCLQSKSQKVAELEQQNKELLLEVEKNSERLKKSRIGTSIEQEIR